MRKIVSIFLMILPSFGAVSQLQGRQPRTHLATLGVAASGVSGQVLAPNLIYTSMQPCRLFDTRVAGGALVANASRQFNAAGVSSGGSLSGQGGNASGCPIPGFDPINSSPQVQAIVVNLTVITPSGTGVLQAWPSDQSKPNASVMNFTAAEVVLANGVVLPVRQDAQGGDITLVSNVGTHVLGDVVGYFSTNSAVQGSGCCGLFLGLGAGNQGTSTAIGNTAVGNYGLSSSTTGNYNTAIGIVALGSNTSGENNAALGTNALINLLTGSNNIAVGTLAGNQYIGSEANNILIGNEGVPGESGVIRIGTSGSGAGQQGSTFIAGVDGVTSSGGTAVFVNSSGQLGTAMSSLRFKENVSDMGAASNDLMNLRPVTFHYKAAYDDGSRLLQYGLIAEEVAKVYPDLVQYDKEGQPQAVRYHFVNAMLLNEVQKQHATIEEQAAQLDQLRQRLDNQETTIATQAERLHEQSSLLATQQARLDELSAQLATIKALVPSPR